MAMNVRAVVVVCALFAPSLARAQPGPPPAPPPAAAAAPSSAPAAPAQAAPPAAPKQAPCIKAYLDAKPGETTLAPAEVEAICNKLNEGALQAHVDGVCPSVAAEFRAARTKVCEAFPQIGATPAYDLVARVYRAANPPLPRPPGAEPSGATGDVHEQGLTAAMAAQGIGNFLTERAEQEVSAFATVELFSRVCSSDVKSVLKRTCDLLEGQDRGANPIGLGLLKRTVTRDLEALPEHLLERALARVREARDSIERNSPTCKKLGKTEESLCTVDVGVAIARALRGKRKLDELFTRPASGGVAQLKRYAILSSSRECAPVWQALEAKLDGSGEDVMPILQSLFLTVEALRLARSANELKLGRATVVEAAMAWVKVADPARDEARKAEHAKLLDELGPLAVAIWNKDWVDVVESAASSDTLGPMLLCESDPGEEGCKRDEKIRLLLSVAADIAAAESSADVQSALNRVVEPVGSWRRKFQDTFTFNLQGYVGGKYAYENVEGVAPSGTSLAPVLAVGLEVSFSLGFGRLGVFGQVVDVGNVASVHFAGEDESGVTEVEVTPDITWAQLFSPGGYVVFAPFKAPFVLGAGGDWVPVLRETPGGSRNVWHLGGFLAVDAPILELAHE
jgi:hypothetical protein